MKGSRVQSIIRELRGEKIDIIPWQRRHRRLRAELAGSGQDHPRLRHQRRAGAPSAPRRHRRQRPALAGHRQARAQRPPGRGADRREDRHQVGRRSQGRSRRRAQRHAAGSDGRGARARPMSTTSKSMPDEWANTLEEAGYDDLDSVINASLGGSHRHRRRRRRDGRADDRDRPQARAGRRDAARGRRRRAGVPETEDGERIGGRSQREAEPKMPKRRRKRRRWSNLSQRRVDQSRRTQSATSTPSNQGDSMAAAKFRVSDIAKKMGKSEKDVIFQFQSLGAEITDPNQVLEPEVIQALITGKKLTTRTRSVIMREDKPQVAAKKEAVRPPRADRQAAAASETRSAGRRAAGRRAAAHGHHPGVRRGRRSRRTRRQRSAGRRSQPKPRPVVAKRGRRSRAGPQPPADAARPPPPPHSAGHAAAARRAAAAPSRRPTGPTGPRARAPQGPRPNYAGQAPVVASDLVWRVSRASRWSGHVASADGRTRPAGPAGARPPMGTRPSGPGVRPGGPMGARPAGPGSFASRRSASRRPRSVRSAAASRHAAGRTRWAAASRGVRRQ